MKNFTVTRYNFEELSDTAKERAIEDMQQFLWRTLDNNEIEDYLRMQLEAEIGGSAEGLDMAFSLSYCQGDGVALYGKLYKKDAPNLSWPNGVEYVNLVKNSWATHYSHYNTFNVEFFDEEWNELSAYTDEMKEPTQVLAKQIRDICRVLEDAGYKHIEGQTSRESAIECLIDNYEDEFTIDGKIDRILVTDMAEVN